jgi:poly(A) polymerase
MEVVVSHVRRKQIPAYVFPEVIIRDLLNSRHVNHHESDKYDTSSVPNYRLFWIF